MLLTTYNPNAQATCPECGPVHCLMTGGILAFSNRYLDFYHEECGTKWRVYVDSGNVEILEPESATR